MAISAGDGGKGSARRLIELPMGSGIAAFKDLFHLAPQVFYRVEIRRVRREIFHSRTHRCNRLPYARHLVRRQVIQHDNVPVFQSGRQPFLHPGQKHLPVHCAIEQPRGLRSIEPHRCDHRRRLIMPLRHRTNQSLPHGTASIAPGHLRAGPAFIHKHQLRCGQVRQLLQPCLSLLDHVGPRLLAGVQRFFYNSTPGD